MVDEDMKYLFLNTNFYLYISISVFVAYYVGVHANFEIVLKIYVQTAVMYHQHYDIYCEFILH